VLEAVFEESLAHVADWKKSIDLLISMFALLRRIRDQITSFDWD
jgi:hypothetical protein